MLERRNHLRIALLLLLVLTVGPGCPLVNPGEVLNITQVSFTHTVVLPGETITMVVETSGPSEVEFEWTAEAGELSSSATAETQWTAPENEQLVAVRVVVRSGEQSVEHGLDLVVGYGVDHDGDGFSLRQGDCDDTDPSVYPGAPDVQDSLDNDCDGVIDEGSPDADDDGDGFSDVEGDCDDTNDEVYPGATEVANEIDDDCDLVVDEGTANYDDDGDGYSENEGDCNDNNSAISPAAPETLDSLDNDCDDTIDEGTAGYDDDGDGYTELEGDCNDDLSAAGETCYPGGVEIADGLDNDCDGLTDEDFLVDEDGDGWSVLAGDCDDTNQYTYLGAPEFLDGEDNDCDNDIDEDIDTADDDGDGLSESDGDCDDSNAAVYPGAVEIDDSPIDIDNDCDGFVFINAPFGSSLLVALGDNCSDGVDSDGDGWTDAADPDCMFGYHELGYGTTACNDGIDNESAPDGQFDSADSGCDSALDDDEEASGPEDCLDGLDGDSDGWVDFADPDCWAAPYLEVDFSGTACNDGVDNEALTPDGLLDADDPECASATDDDEESTDPDDCADGADGDGDGWADDLDPDCWVAPFDELGPGSVSECNDGIDNDGNGLVDSADPACTAASQPTELTTTCTEVGLDGFNSWDPDGDSLVYYWYYSHQPIHSELLSSGIAGGSSASASFTPDVPGYWQIGLIVSDGIFNSDPVLLSMQVTAASCP
ncbi:MAG: MopE-related protein [Myxococcota bacterium]|nr:MopE-related protein [Myxococcota bacterium]